MDSYPLDIASLKKFLSYGGEGEPPDADILQAGLRMEALEKSEPTLKKKIAKLASISRYEDMSRWHDELKKVGLFAYNGKYLGMALLNYVVQELALKSCALNNEPEEANSNGDENKRINTKLVNISNNQKAILKAFENVLEIIAEMENFKEVDVQEKEYDLRKNLECLNKVLEKKYKSLEKSAKWLISHTQELQAKMRQEAAPKGYVFLDFCRSVARVSKNNARRVKELDYRKMYASVAHRLEEKRNLSDSFSALKGGKDFITLAEAVDIYRYYLARSKPFKGRHPLLMFSAEMSGNYFEELCEHALTVHGTVSKAYLTQILSNMAKEDLYYSVSFKRFYKRTPSYMLLYLLSAYINRDEYSLENIDKKIVGVKVSTSKTVARAMKLLQLSEIALTINEIAFFLGIKSTKVNDLLRRTRGRENIFFIDGWYREEKVYSVMGAEKKIEKRLKLAKARNLSGLGERLFYA